MIEIGEFSGSPQNVDRQTLEKVTNSQKSDTTTITLSSPSQMITMDSQDLSPVYKLPNVAEKECQTMDGVFLSVEEYASLLQKASFCPNFSDDLIKIWSHIYHLQCRSKLDNWGGLLFIYSCSALISFEIDCFYGLRTRIYEYQPPPSPIIELATALIICHNQKWILLPSKAYAGLLVLRISIIV